MRRRVLFTCENRQEVEALVPIAREIEKISDSQVQCEFLSQDAFYCQGVDHALQESQVRIAPFSYPIRLSKPFAFNSLITKLRALLATNRQIAPIMEHYDGLVCGVDSAVARMLIASAHRLGKPSFQVIVSLLVSGKNQKVKCSLIDIPLNVLKYRVKVWLARLTHANFLALPIGVARSGCGRIFVSGEKMRRRLIQDGVPEQRITVYGVPRFTRLFELAELLASSSYAPHGSINILYIPGAFAAHGATVQHRLQQQQLREITEHLLESAPDCYRLVIKMHPREREEFYTWLKDYKNVQILKSNVDVYKAILESTMVVTICSTVSYEALLLNRPVIIARFPSPELLSYEPLINDFLVVDSPQELMKVVTNISGDPVRYATLVKDESRSVYDVIDRKTPQSAFLIARQICADIGVNSV